MVVGRRLRRHTSWRRRDCGRIFHLPRPDEWHAPGAYKLLQFSSPQYFRDTITIQPSRSTRSSDLVTLLRPPVRSRFMITNCSFRHTAPQLWKKLPHSLREVRVPYQSGSSLSFPLSSGSNPKPAVNLSHGMYHSRLKTCLFPSLFLLSSPVSHGLITW